MADGNLAAAAVRCSPGRHMHFFSKHIDGLFLTDWQTLVLLGLICALAAYFIKEYLAHPPLIIFVYPFLLLFSILVQYFFLQIDLFSPKKLDQWLTWTVIASICGTTIGIGLMAGAAILRERASHHRA
jgi:hypothetical protein